MNDNLDDNGDPNPLIQPDLPAYSRGVTPIPTGSVPPANGQIRERKVEDAEWNNGLFECLSRFDLRQFSPDIPYHERNWDATACCG